MGTKRKGNRSGRDVVSSFPIVKEDGNGRAENVVGGRQKGPEALMTGPTG